MHLWIVKGQAEDVFEGYVKLLIVNKPSDNRLKRSPYLVVAAVKDDSNVSTFFGHIEFSGKVFDKIQYLFKVPFPGQFYAS